MCKSDFGSGEAIFGFLTEKLLCEKKLNAVGMNSSIRHAVKVLSAFQVPKLVEETELSLLHENVHDDVEVQFRGLSRDLLIFIKEFVKHLLHMSKAKDLLVFDTTMASLFSSSISL